MPMANISVASSTSARRRPGPTAGRDDLRDAGLRPAAHSSLRLVWGSGLRRHDGVERAGTISTGTKLSAIGAGAE